MLCWIQPCTTHRSGPEVLSATRSSPRSSRYTTSWTARACPFCSKARSCRMASTSARSSGTLASGSRISGLVGSCMPARIARSRQPRSTNREPKSVSREAREEEGSSLRDSFQQPTSRSFPAFRASRETLLDRLVSGGPGGDGFLAVFQGGDHGEADEALAGGAEVGAGDNQDAAGGEAGRVGVARVSRRDVHPEVERALTPDL